MSAEDDMKYARDYRLGRPWTQGGIQAERDKHMFDHLNSPQPKMPSRKERREQRASQEYAENAEHWKRQWEQGQNKGVTDQQPPATPKALKLIDWVMAGIVWLICWIAMRPSTSGAGGAALALVPSLIALKFWRPVLTFSVVGFVIWLFVHSSK